MKLAVQTLLGMAVFLGVWASVEWLATALPSWLGLLILVGFIAGAFKLFALIVDEVSKR